MDELERCYWDWKIKDKSFLTQDNGLVDQARSVAAFRLSLAKIQSVKNEDHVDFMGPREEGIGWFMMVFGRFGLPMGLITNFNFQTLFARSSEEEEYVMGLHESHVIYL